MRASILLLMHDVELLPSVGEALSCDSESEKLDDSDQEECMEQASICFQQQAL